MESLISSIQFIAVGTMVVMAVGILLRPSYDGAGRMTGLLSTVMLIPLIIFFPKLVDMTLGFTRSMDGQASPSTPTSSAKPKPSPSSVTVHTSPTSSATPTPTSTATHKPGGSSFTPDWMLIGVIALIAVGALIFVVACYFTYAKIKDHNVSAESKRIEKRKALEIERQVNHDWSVARTQFETLAGRWNAYESDPQKFMEIPAIRDVGVPEVAAAIDALTKAENLNEPYAPQGTTSVRNTAFFKAIQAGELAVDEAVRAAQTVRDVHMSTDERALLTEAQKLLARALDSGASPAERDLCYERFEKIVARLKITLPGQTMRSLEATQRKLIEA